MSTPSHQITRPATAHRSGVHPAVILLLICGAQLMIVLDGTVVNIALPSVESALHFSPENLAWVINAYTLAFGGLLLLGGRAGDLFGQRRMFVLGVLVFTAASFAGGLATSEAWLLSARAIQGIGAAIASPTALSLIATNFDAGPARNRAVGAYAAVSGAGASIGLLAGGLLTDLLDWRWVLFVNVPIGLAIAFAAPRLLGESATRSGRLDLGGAITGGTGITLLVFALIRASETSWSDNLTLASFGAAAVLLAAFLFIETKAAEPLIPLTMFTNRARAGSYLVALASVAAMFSMFFFLTQFVQEVLNYSPLRAGVAFLPFSITIVLVSGVSAKLVGWIGPRPLLVAGGLLNAFGLLWMSQISLSSSYLTGVLAPCLVMATGMGLSFVPVTLTAVHGVPREDAGVASGMLNTAQQVGGSLGLAVLVTIAASTTASSDALVPLGAFVDGWSTAIRIGAVFAIAGAIIAAVMITGVRPATEATEPVARDDGEPLPADRIPDHISRRIPAQPGEAAIPAPELAAETEP